MTSPPEVKPEVTFMVKIPNLWNGWLFERRLTREEAGALQRILEDAAARIDTTLYEHSDYRRY